MYLMKLVALTKNIYKSAIKSQQRVLVRFSSFVRLIELIPDTKKSVAVSAGHVSISTWRKLVVFTKSILYTSAFPLGM